MRIRVQATPASCPTCGRDIAWRHVAFARSFTCPFCHTRLRVRGRRVLKEVAAAIAFLVAFAAGARGWWLVWVGFAATLPIEVVVLVVSLRLFSVEFEPTGEVRDILYPVEDSGSDAPPPPTERPGPTRIGARAWEFFVGINQPRSVEGFAIQAGFLILAVWMVWVSVAPLVRVVVPEFDAHRSGPRGFPVSVHIGSWTIAFTNGSEMPWTCRAQLGVTHLADTFDLPAGKTVPIDFARFDPQGTIDQSGLRAAAQARITLECREPSGRRHFATLR